MQYASHSILKGVVIRAVKRPRQDQVQALSLGTPDVASTALHKQIQLARPNAYFATSHNTTLTRPYSI